MELQLNGEQWWVTRLRLDSWAGYETAIYEEEIPDGAEGTIAFVFAPENRDIGPLKASELAMIAWFERNEPSVSAAVKAAILDWSSPDNPNRACPFDFVDIPLMSNEEDLKANIQPGTIFVHPFDPDGIPIIGYELECEWEVEHGLGVLMHGTRVLAIGEADIAFDAWTVEEHAEKAGWTEAR